MPKKEKFYILVCPCLLCHYKIAGNWLDKMHEDYKKHYLVAHFKPPIIQKYDEEEETKKKKS